MSHQEWNNSPKVCLYDQLTAVKGVQEVYWYSDTNVVGFYINGGDDSDIADAIAMHTYSWNVGTYKGDTEFRKEFFTAWFYRDYHKFIADANSHGIFL